MKQFWEDSPLYQRKQEAFAAYERAAKEENEAGALVLASVRMDATGGQIWRERTDSYKSSVEDAWCAFNAMIQADEDFRTSHVGQAFARWLKDPLAPAAPAEQEAA